jgi:conjugative transfer protein CagX
MISVIVMAAALRTIPVCAQSPITTVTLNSDQIGVIKTAPGITTRVVFPEAVNEIVCGDLYDPGSGKGTFVVQRSGNDAFIKPVASKGLSNMFVKTGDGRRTYNFDLKVVTTTEAHRIVNVVDSTPPESSRDPKVSSNQAGTADPPARDITADLERRRAEIEQAARNKADEIIRNAKQQAERITTESQARIQERERQTSDQADREAQRRLVQALLSGVREARVHNGRTAPKRIIVTLEAKMLTFDEKSYLRYTIQNSSTAEFTFNAVSLEIVNREGGQVLPIEIVQSKSENRLEPGESLAGVVIFDTKLVKPSDKLSLYVRREDRADILHLDLR